MGKISLKEIILISLSFIKEYYIFSKNQLSLIIFFLSLWISIKQSLNRLDALPNVKSAIFGFDLVSPRSHESAPTTPISHQFLFLPQKLA